MGYHWNDFLYKWQLFCEAELRLFISLVHKCQLWLYWHVACHLEVNCAHQVVSVRVILEWSRAKGLPQISWIEEGDRLFHGGLRMGRRLVWKLS